MQTLRAADGKARHAGSISRHSDHLRVVLLQNRHAHLAGVTASPQLRGLQWPDGELAVVEIAASAPKPDASDEQVLRGVWGRDPHSSSRAGIGRGYAFVTAFVRSGTPCRWRERRRRGWIRVPAKASADASPARRAAGHPGDQPSTPAAAQPRAPRAFRRRSWPAPCVGESSRGALPG
jgi:hypothetical protein